MVLSEECRNGRCNECPIRLGNGELCGHGCAGHINTLSTSSTMDQKLREQLAEQDKIDPITPNKPHLA